MNFTMSFLDIFIPSKGQLTGEIEQFSNATLNELISPKFKQYDEFIKLLEKEPIAAKCSALKILRAQIAFGEYVHTNREYQEFIRSNFSTMEGNLRQTIGRLGSAMPIGMSLGEIVFSTKIPGFRGELRLKKIVPCNPKRVSFKGIEGKVKYVTYTNPRNIRIDIPYNKFIHVVNSGSTPWDNNLLWGVGDCEQALNYYKIKLIVMSEVTHAAKNNGSGHIWGKTDSDSNVILRDSKGNFIPGPDGKPISISKQRGLTYQLEQLPSSNIIVTDNNTDLRALQFNSGERFWEYVIQLIEKNIYMSFGIPPSMFSEGASSALGNLGLSENHKSVVDASVEGFVTQIKELIIEQVVRPLLIWNFGEKKDFGSFVYTAQEDGATINGRITTILSAIASGVFSADDPDIQEKLREWLGLSPMSEIEKKSSREQRATQEILKMLENQAAISTARKTTAEDPLSIANPVNAAAETGANLEDVPGVKDKLQTSFEEPYP